MQHSRAAQRLFLIKFNNTPQQSSFWRISLISNEFQQSILATPTLDGCSSFLWNSIGNHGDTALPGYGSFPINSNTKLYGKGSESLSQIIRKRVQIPVALAISTSQVDASVDASYSWTIPIGNHEKKSNDCSELIPYQIQHENLKNLALDGCRWFHSYQIQWGNHEECSLVYLLLIS